MALRSSFWRYTAFQVPGWIIATAGGWFIHYWFNVSLWLAMGVLVFWVIKDYALYPFLRSAYQIDHRLQIERMIGHTGNAIETLSPTGYIRVRGELWLARTESNGRTVEAKEPVVITGIDGSTLVVTPTTTSAPRGGT